MTKVYIAGPYSKGDVAQNVRRAIEVADILVTHGYTPYIPHLTHFWHMVCPRPYDFWLDYDNEWLKLCDAIYRIPGESSGADKEVKLATQLGIPVFENDILALMAHFHAD